MTDLIHPDLLSDPVAPLHERVDEEVREEDDEKAGDRRLEHREPSRDGEDAGVDQHVVEKDLPVLGLAKRHPLALLKAEVGNEVNSERNREREPHTRELQNHTTPPSWSILSISINPTRAQRKCRSF